MATEQNPSVAQRIVEGLDEAIAWSQGKKTGARVTLVTVTLVTVTLVTMPERGRASVATANGPGPVPVGDAVWVATGNE